MPRLLLLFLFALGLAAGAAAQTPPASSTPPGEIDDDETSATPAAAKPDPAAERYWQAIKLFGSKLPTDRDAGKAALQAAADLEFVHAQVQLAQCHLTGSYGFAKDARRAVNLLRLAAERGNGFAQVSLAACTVTGTGTRRNEELAVEWLRKAVAPTADFSRPTPPADFEFGAGSDDGGLVSQQAGNPANAARASAHFLLGSILAKRKPTAEAQEHFVAAANGGPDGRDGVFQAAVAAALNFAFGQGVPRDLPKAHAMLARSRELTARLGVSLVHNYSSLKLIDDFAVASLEENMDEIGQQIETTLQYKIAAQFADRKSKDYNPAEAARWYELAAQNGEGWAMVQLALLHGSDLLGQPDRTKAFEWLEKAGGGEKPKNFLAVSNLAISYAHGLGTPKDPAKAAALFEKYKESELVCYLGTLGQAPTDLVSREQLLGLMETWARKKNNPRAQSMWGLLLLDARYEKADFDAGLRWLKKAAKAKDGPALNHLGFLHQDYYWRMGETREQGAKAAIEFYRQAAEAGHLLGMANYALALSDGRLGPRDERRAEELFLRCLSVQPDFGAAHNNLAVIYRRRFEALAAIAGETPRTALRAKILEHFEAAARAGEAVAAVNLGDIYRQGSLTLQDLRRAYSYYEQAASLGWERAHLTLGEMHERGEGVPVTLTEAAYHYRLAALDGDSEALRRLVNFYIGGKGGSLDLDRAMFWLRRLALLHPGALPTLCDILIRNGDYDNATKMLKELLGSRNDILSGYAHHRLSECYLAGHGVKRNPDRAKKFFDIAVTKGDGEALCKLGMDLMKAKKNAEGVAMFERAAKTSRDANFYLGQLHYFGTEVPKDEKRALTYFRAAAERNHTDAMLFLASLAYNRADGAPSLEEAVRLAEQAEALGSPKAAAVRARLEQRRQELARPAEQTARARSS